MRCFVCSAEMILVGVAQDQTMAVSGFEHHTFMCSECRDIERRLVFMKNGREAEIVPDDYAVPLPTGAAPPTVPLSAEQEHDLVAPGLFSRVLERIRGY
jgi:hypothetical protein